jgi:hypothetical protein
MKRNASKGTKQGLKDTFATKKKKEGRGGARPGAGRKKKYEDTQQINFDAPKKLIEAMLKAKIENKTAYIIELIAKDLKIKL